MALFRLSAPTGGLANRTHHLLMLGICVATVILFWRPLRATALLPLHDDRYVQIILAPLLCLGLLYWHRKTIFAAAHSAPRLGIPLLGILLLVGLFLNFGDPRGDDSDALPVGIAVVLIWMAAFILCYGPRCFKLAIYPLCCLLLVAPIPPAWLDRVTAFFQHGSAIVSYFVLDSIGIPVLRRDMVFSLPGLDFQIAPECSGIRSALAFLMAGLLAGGLYLRSGWRRLILILATIPIAIFKNAVRIVVITTLGAYVNRSFIDGPFHHQYGGIVFGPLDLVLFIPLLIGLQKLDRRALRLSGPLPEAARL